jgi:hypothetical protein
LAVTRNVTTEAKTTTGIPIAVTSDRFTCKPYLLIPL